jgi:hypothetical protein
LKGAKVSLRLWNVSRARRTDGEVLHVWRLPECDREGSWKRKQWWVGDRDQEIKRKCKSPKMGTSYSHVKPKARRK